MICFTVSCPQRAPSRSILGTSSLFADHGITVMGCYRGANTIANRLASEKQGLIQSLWSLVLPFVVVGAWSRLVLGTAVDSQVCYKVYMCGMEMVPLYIQESHVHLYIMGIVNCNLRSALCRKLCVSVCRWSRLLLAT